MVSPTVSVNPTSFTLDAGESITLNGLATDLDGTIVSMGWTLNGTSLSTTGSLLITAPPLLTTEVRNYVFSATDNSGATSTATTVVTVTRADWRIKNANGTLTPFVLHQGPWSANAPVQGSSLRTPIATTAPGFTSGTSINTVNPDRTTL